ncbi:MAG: hypothetical protein NTV80_19055 [Verrucomicrobia bacterium]|nr:hypothetical protein [Verrucomicrobiota bacterium]
MFEAWNVMLHELALLSLFRINRHRGINLSLLIHTKEHRAIKAVVCAQDLGHHRHRLLAAVFLIGGDEHHMLSFARTFTT